MLGLAETRQHAATAAPFCLRSTASLLVGSTLVPQGIWEPEVFPQDDAFSLDAISLDAFSLDAFLCDACLRDAFLRDAFLRDAF